MKTSCIAVATMSLLLGGRALAQPITECEPWTDPLTGITECLAFAAAHSFDACREAGPHTDWTDADPATLSRRSTANRTDVVMDDAAALQKALEMIHSAHDHVLFETFLLNGDAGGAIVDALIAKHQEGVNVQVLLDPNALETQGMIANVLNPDGINTPFYEKLKAAGVDVRKYDIRALTDAKTTQRAEHAKLLVVDGRAAMMGGTNFDRDVNHDVDFVIRGPAVADLEVNFSEGWANANGTPASSPYAGVRDNSACGPMPVRAGDPPPNSDVRILSTGPGSRSPKETLLAAIRAAKTSVSMEMYGLTDEDIIDELHKATKRGVDVKVILFDDVDRGVFSPLRGDYDNFPAMVSFAEKDREVPTRLFLPFDGGQMHTKMMLVDGDTAFVGSTNFTKQEFIGVHDYVAEIHGQQVVDSLAGIFDKDWNLNSSDKKIQDWVWRRDHENNGNNG